MQQIDIDATFLLHPHVHSAYFYSEGDALSVVLHKGEKNPTICSWALTIGDRE